MISFLLIFFSIASLGVILVLVARSWPHLRGVQDTDVDPADLEHASLTVRLTSDFPMYMDQVLNRVLERFYRRLKVVVLKADNLLAEQIKRHTRETKELKPKIDFKEIEHTTELERK